MRGSFGEGLTHAPRWLRTAYCCWTRGADAPTGADSVAAVVVAGATLSAPVVFAAFVASSLRVLVNVF